MLLRIAFWKILEKNSEKMIFLENLQVKNISSKFAGNASKQLFLPITTFPEVLVVHYRPQTSKKKYLQNIG